MSNNTRSSDRWADGINEIFPVSVPKRAIWTDRSEIIQVLNHLVRGRESSNHTFLPDGGGLDLHSSKLASEPKCIELNLNGITYIVRPTRLIFRSYGPDLEWSFFRLETGGLKPILDESEGRQREELYEVSPGEYIEYHEDENSITDDYRHVVRIINGAFVTFDKESDYNLESYKGLDPYNAPHNKMKAKKFEKVIAHLLTL